MGYPGQVHPDETARSYEIKVKERVEGEREALAGGVTKWGLYWNGCQCFNLVNVWC